ncbi:hypothetical protein BC781_10317 [Sediminitomix flava]|uniref:Uncharacterized protein n=1 Tax=Sediminitomix flava TaxID=379075 RepID=A0A315ZWR4_SEDFL|nr:hypothetical protein BC781_10317 [Sediminitomix flava]
MIIGVGKLINSLKKNKDIVFELEGIDHINLELFKSEKSNQLHPQSLPKMFSFRLNIQMV